MATPKQLKKRFDFIYPQLYRQLYAHGRLDQGTAGPDWISQRLLDKDDFEADLQIFFRTHQPYVNARQQNVLEKIYAIAGKPLISEAQFQHILQSEISFEQLDKSFKYPKS